MIVLIGVLFCPLTSWALERWPYERIAFIRDGQVWSASSKLYDQGQPLISINNCNRLFGSPQRGNLVFQTQDEQVWAWEGGRHWPLITPPPPGEDHGALWRLLVGISPTGKGMYTWFYEGPTSIIYGHLLPGYSQKEQQLGALFFFPQSEYEGRVEGLETVSISCDQNFGAFVCQTDEGTDFCLIIDTSTKYAIVEMGRGPEFDVSGAAFHPNQPHLLAYARNFYQGTLPREFQYSQVVVRDFQINQETVYYTDKEARLGKIVWTPDGQNLIFEKGPWSEREDWPLRTDIILLTLNPVSTYEILRGASWPTLY